MRLVGMRRSERFELVSTSCHPSPTSCLVVMGADWRWLREAEAGLAPGVDAAATRRRAV